MTEDAEVGGGRARPTVAERFARELQDLRERAGSPSFKEMDARLKRLHDPRSAGSRNKFWSMVGEPVSVPEPAFVRGFVLAAGYGEVEAVEWEARRVAAVTESQRLREPDPSELPAAAPAPAHQPRARWMAAAGALVAALVVGLMTALGPGESSGRPERLTGQVRCLTGAAVVGVWVDTGSRDTSGYAHLVPAAGAGTSRFEHVLPQGTRYAVHVGCGGSPQQWASNNRSLPGTGNGAEFACHDAAPASPEARPYRGVCDRL